jgi:hypothetical protein
VDRLTTQSSQDVIAAHGDVKLLRALAVGAGLSWALIFLVVGVGFDLQLFGDGAVFSYAVAVQDSWAFHWHNIVARVFVYLYAVAPAEAFVGLTQSARGGIVLYGLLFFGAQLFGLAATYAVDPSPRRTIFVYACASVALACPLAFGFPTEALIAHALFWPTLAVCHRGRTNVMSIALMLLLQAALIFTHAGAIILIAAVLLSLVLRGALRAALVAGSIFVALVAVWIVVKLTYPPDAYIAEILHRAMLHVFDPAYVINGLLVLLGAALAAYGATFFLLRKIARAPVYAAALTAAALAFYWLVFDTQLHAENRYYMRTAIILTTPALGLAATLTAYGTPYAGLSRLLSPLWSATAIRAAIGAIAIVTLVHAVETAKFVKGWNAYQSAIAALGQSDASDPALGDARFISTRRIDSSLDRLSWWSTTHFLSVLVAPGMTPHRLVVDPRPNFFWISCATAMANADAPKAVPAESRGLIAAHACLHRK